MIPAEVVLLRAVHAAERAQLLLTAGRHSEAAQSIDETITLIQQALSS